MSDASAQMTAADPRLCAFVEANAGAGKTTTLVNRVARLLLDGARPEAILCVTYTKAAAAEMQSRLFARLGSWAVMADEPLLAELTGIGEPGAELSRARALFARALETPGGLRIQTLHGFCEGLLRRFPLEAGVTPGFSVLDDVETAALSSAAQDDLALAADADPEGPIGRAFARLNVELSYSEFGEMLNRLARDRGDIGRYVESCGGSVARDVWRRLGLGEPRSLDEVEAEGQRIVRWRRWRETARILSESDRKTMQARGAKMSECNEASPLKDLLAPFIVKDETLAKSLSTKDIPSDVQDYLEEIASRLHAAYGQLVMAHGANLTVDMLLLAKAYEVFYEARKGQRGALDFGDLVARTAHLLRAAPNAAWVLYKLDGGIDHLLLDEAQDTAPEQWDILRALTEESFAGQGAQDARRSVFVVGDPKQSIFSFQGAEPRRLAVETQHFAALSHQAGRRFVQPKLVRSWRSTSEVLQAVDSVFAEGPALRGVRPGADPGSGPDQATSIVAFPLRHEALRQSAGRVDLWPPEANATREEASDVWVGGEAEPVQSAHRRHADRIAREVRTLIDRGQGVWETVALPSGQKRERLRPCRAGDILVLVRRRNALFHELIRAFKRLGVPVGGPDRLDLAVHGLFQDLTALGRFALYPGDDLALAGLLRSPLCEVSEESLFALAHGREGGLWTALTRRAAERPEWASAAERLSWAREILLSAPPFDGFSRVLARLDPQGRSLRQRFLTRLGGEGEDALNAVLAQLLAAEEAGIHDLEGVVARLLRLDQEIKRDPDPAETPDGGEVRVMTTHAAKGLEAPIVFLPDTTSRADETQEGPWLKLSDGGYAWARKTPFDTPVLEAARQARKVRIADESARLLYVAMTRARDWLIISGVELAKAGRFEGSWRDLVERGLAGMELRPTCSVSGVEILRLGQDPEAMAREAPDAAGTWSGPPAWALSLARAETGPLRAAPSGLLASDEPETAISPLAARAGLGPYRRGEIIHGLLEQLPDLPREARAAAAASWLARERDLSDSAREEMAAAALGVLEDPMFAAVFGPGSRAEVAVAGSSSRLPQGLRLSGRIDRLVVTPKRVLIVDFKTNRPAPDKIEAAPPAYIRQMAAYVAVLEEIYPDRTIEAALIWTDGPRLMPVPATLMDSALSDIASRFSDG